MHKMHHMHNNNDCTRDPNPDIEHCFCDVQSAENLCTLSPACVERVERSAIAFFVVGVSVRIFNYGIFFLTTLAHLRVLLTVVIRQRGSAWHEQEPFHVHEHVIAARASDSMKTLTLQKHRPAHKRGDRTCHVHWLLSVMYKGVRCTAQR